MNSISLALGATAVAAAGMLFITGERWISHLSTRPDILTGHPGPGVVVILQEGDCPDARTRAGGFARLASAEGVSVDEIVIADVGFDPADVIRRRRVHRAILGAGIESTPALLLTDRTGRVRFARSLTAATTDQELHDLVAAFRAVLGVLEPEPSAPEASAPVAAGEEG